MYGYGYDACLYTEKRELIEKEFIAKGIKIISPLNMTDYQNKETVIEDLVGFLFPGLCPINYSLEWFKEGEIVYVNEKRIKRTYWTEKEYVEASDGQSAGYIKRDLLQ